MSTEVVIALISLAGIVITALVTKNAMSHELDKRITITEVKLSEYTADVKELVRSVPVVQEQIRVINHRIEDIERRRDYESA